MSETASNECTYIKQAVTGSESEATKETNKTVDPTIHQVRISDPLIILELSVKGVD